MKDWIRDMRLWLDDIERVYTHGLQRFKLGLVNSGFGLAGGGTPGASTNTVPPITVPTPAPAPTEPMPAFIRGKLDPLVWAEICRVAPSVGVEPATLAAVQVWESGWYTSNLFRMGWNVGGIKYRPDLPALGHTLPPYVSEEGYMYATFTDWKAGIAAHARFLAQGRYDAIRRTDDPVAEVRAIHDAGYAEKDLEWLEGVTKLAKKFAGMTTEVRPTPADGTPLTARIRAAALALPDPFPYAPETESGNLGCANVVSHALIQAGVIDHIELAVDGLARELERLGWVKVETPYKEGDVVVWGKRPGQSHKHVGILILEGPTVMTVQNSSSRRKVVRLPLATYDRPIEKVLRAPGA